MSQKYYTVLTDIGANKLANATALGGQLKITTMAVGDGGGSLPMPEPGNKKLVHENRRGAINQLSVDPENPNHLIAEQIIPEQDGGWWVREIAIFDEDGDMIAVGNCPESYKPKLQEGSGRTQIIRMILVVSSTASVTLKIDPSVVLATQKYVTETVDKKIKESEEKAAKTYQPIGDYVLHPYLKLEMLKKFDKASIANQLGNDTDKAGSLALLTAELGKKAPSGNYAIKGDSYTKTEADNRHQPKGSYAPSANYAMEGDSYTKTEADNRHQPKGDYQAAGYSYSKTESNNAYQPKGSYQAAGYSYSKTESDSRYEKKGAAKGWRWVGGAGNVSSSVAMSEDVRGRQLYLQLTGSGGSGYATVAMPPVDNIATNMHQGADGHCVVSSQSYGRTLKSSGGQYFEWSAVYIAD